MQSLPAPALITVLNQTSDISQVVNLCASNKKMRDRCISDTVKNLLKYKYRDFQLYAASLIEEGKNINLEAVRFLLDYGLDPYWMMFEAIRFHRYELYRLIVHYIPDINRITEPGPGTLLRAAIQEYDPIAVRLLLQSGADPNQAVYNMSPLDYALSRSDKTEKSDQIVLELIRNGAKYDPSEVFMEAIRGNLPRVMAMTINQGVNPFQMDINQRTSLDLALDERSNAVAYVLIRLGIPSRPYSASDISNLIDLRIHPEFAKLESIIQSIVDSPAFQRIERTPTTHILVERYSPLVQNIIQGNIAGAERLLEQGADPNEMDANGWTPLFYAIHQNNPEMVNLLIVYGANPHISGAQGQSPLDYAIFKKKNRALQALASYE